jgi:hypothetical protein
MEYADTWDHVHVAVARAIGSQSFPYMALHVRPGPKGKGAEHAQYIERGGALQERAVWRDWRA